MAQHTAGGTPETHGTSEHVELENGSETGRLRVERAAEWRAVHGDDPQSLGDNATLWQ